MPIQETVSMRRQSLSTRLVESEALAEDETHRRVRQADCKEAQPQRHAEEICLNSFPL